MQDLVARSLANKANVEVEGIAVIPKRLGNETTDSPAIKRAIEKIVAKGAGTLLLPFPSITINEPILIYSNIQYKGLTKMGTKIKVADGANCDVFKTYNFEALSPLHNGGNFPSDYYDVLPQGFSIFDFYVDGNYLAFDANKNRINDGGYYKKNNTVGYGMKIYGRNYEIDRVRIDNIPQVGAYFECKDSETGNINIQITNTGYEGLVYKGSPDATIERVNVGKVGLHAKRFDGTIDPARNVSVLYPTSAIDGMVIDKTVELGEVHTWGCDTGFAFRGKAGHRIKVRQLMAEGSLNGAFLEDSRFQIALMDLHNNREITLQTAGDNGKQISNLEIVWDKNPSDYGLTGWGNTLVINGNNHIIKGLIRLGDKCIGDAITLTGSNNDIDMIIRSYINSNVIVYNGGQRNIVKLVTENSKNVLKLTANMAIGNKFDLSAQTKPTQTLFDLGAFALNNTTSEYSVLWQQTNDDGSNISTKTSRDRVILSNAVNLDSTSVQNINVPHNFFIQPHVRDIDIGLNSASSISDYEVAILKATTITATTITVQVKLSVASATAGAKGSLILKID